MASGDGNELEPKAMNGMTYNKEGYDKYYVVPTLKYIESASIETLKQDMIKRPLLLGYLLWGEWIYKSTYGSTRPISDTAQLKINALKAMASNDSLVEPTKKANPGLKGNHYSDLIKNTIDGSSPPETIDNFNDASYWQKFNTTNITPAMTELKTGGTAMPTTTAAPTATAKPYTPEQLADPKIKATAQAWSDYFAKYPDQRNKYTLDEAGIPKRSVTAAGQWTPEGGSGQTTTTTYAPGTEGSIPSKTTTTGNYNNGSGTTLPIMPPTQKTLLETLNQSYTLAPSVSAGVQPASFWDKLGDAGVAWASGADLGDIIKGWMTSDDVDFGTKAMQAFINFALNGGMTAQQVMDSKQFKDLSIAVMKDSAINDPTNAIVTTVAGQNAALKALTDLNLKVPPEIASKMAADNASLTADQKTLLTSMPIDTTAAQGALDVAKSATAAIPTSVSAESKTAATTAMTDASGVTAGLARLSDQTNRSYGLTADGPTGTSVGQPPGAALTGPAGNETNNAAVGNIRTTMQQQSLAEINAARRAGVPESTILAMEQNNARKIEEAVHAQTIADQRLGLAEQLKLLSFGNEANKTTISAAQGLSGNDVAGMNSAAQVAQLANINAMSQQSLQKLQADIIAQKNQLMEQMKTGAISQAQLLASIAQIDQQGEIERQRTIQAGQAAIQSALASLNSVVAGKQTTALTNMGNTLQSGLNSSAANVNAGMQAAAAYQNTINQQQANAANAPSGYAAMINKYTDKNGNINWGELIKAGGQAAYDWWNKTYGSGSAPAGNAGSIPDYTGSPDISFPSTPTPTPVPPIIVTPYVPPIVDKPGGMPDYTGSPKITFPG